MTAWIAFFDMGRELTTPEMAPFSARSFNMPIKPSNPVIREAKLFRNNRSQAVRIPMEFGFPGDRVLIHREGSKLIIEPTFRPTSILELLAQSGAKSRHWGQKTSFQAFKICPPNQRTYFEWPPTLTMEAFAHKWRQTVSPSAPMTY